MSCLHALGVMRFGNGRFRGVSKVSEAPDANQPYKGMREATVGLASSSAGLLF
jgi:hypothetical protein